MSDRGLVFRAALGLFALRIVGLVGPDAAKAEEGGVRFSARCLMVSPNEGCAVGDVDRDGRPDVVAGTHWFRAPAFVPRPVRDIPQVMGEYYANNGDHLHDVDGDGWLDVISGGWMEAEQCWYKNPGKLGLERGYKWPRHLLKETRGQNECFELKDFDGDGTPELLVNCWKKKDPVVVWKLTKTDGRPDLERVVLGADGGGHGFAFGDINGDGREDLAVETGWYERPEGDPLARPWEFHPETALPHPSCPFVIYDVNGDGRSDLLWGKAHDYGLFWWEQDEPKPDGTTTWTEHVIDKSWSQVHVVVRADLDGDGTREIVTGKRVRGHAGKDPGGDGPAVMYYYQWNARAKDFDRFTISAPGAGVGTGMQIAAADLNGDGRIDLAVSGKTGTYVLINEGRSTP